MALYIQLIAYAIENNKDFLKNSFEKLDKLEVSHITHSKQNEFLNQICSVIFQETLLQPKMETCDAVDLIGVNYIHQFSACESSLENIEQKVQQMNHSQHLETMIESLFANAAILKDKNEEGLVPDIQYLFQNNYSISNFNKNKLRELIYQLSLPQKFSDKAVCKEYYDNCIKIQLSKTVFAIESILKIDLQKQNLNKNIFLFTSKLIADYKINNPILVDYKLIPEPISIMDEIKDIWDDIMKVVCVIIETKNKYDEITKTTQE